MLRAWNDSLPRAKGEGRRVDKHADVGHGLQSVGVGGNASVLSYLGTRADEPGDSQIQLVLSLPYIVLLLIYLAHYSYILAMLRVRANPSPTSMGVLDIEKWSRICSNSGAVQQCI